MIAFLFIKLPRALAELTNWKISYSKSCSNGNYIFWEDRKNLLHFLIQLCNNSFYLHLCLRQTKQLFFLFQAYFVILHLLLSVKLEIINIHSQKFCYTISFKNAEYIKFGFLSSLNPLSQPSLISNCIDSGLNMNDVLIILRN